MHEILYENARVMAQLRISLKKNQLDQLVPAEPLTPQHIRTVVDKVLADDDFAAIASTVRDRLIAELDSGFNTFVGIARSLASRTHQPWLRKRKAEIRWDFWRRYREHLVVRGGWADPAILALDDFTDIALDFIPDASREDTWDCRGLVVGHVQSGKTSNYTGLICKAADAGYKVIVVLAGMHKSLRTQTQIRLEEGFLGIQTPSGRAKGSSEGLAVPVGVGLSSNLRANWATTRADSGDFSKVAANHYGVTLSGNGPPVLFVVKKNGSVLKNLVAWVRSKGNAKDGKGDGYVSGVPLLVIDDEADQGSIDTKAKERNEDGVVDEDHDPTILNKRIRELLKLFDRSSYVAYTATPFANVLIHGEDSTSVHGDDLFPRDFIVSLPAPSNYVGPVRAFGIAGEDRREEQDPLPIIRRIDDWLDSPEDPSLSGWMPLQHKKGHVPLYRSEPRVPPSLSEAICAFILSVGARIARGQASKHNTMLVHVTRFNDVQHAVVEQVKSELARIKSECGFDGPIWGRLEDLWTCDFEATTSAMKEPDCLALSWDDVARHIAAAVESVTVHEVNGSAGDILDYETHKQGLNVIAVGGDKLSRGLTLEGLSISYFLRASRMYDTLMQMGRWFGYRPGYLDLCRIYTTDELVDWFEHITLANEELRDEFNAMASARQTPREYGHRVRSHPVLLVTSQVKMRDGEKVRISFSGSISETVVFERSSETVRSNFAALKSLVAQMGGRIARLDDLPNPGLMKLGSQRLVWAGVSPDAVMSFLELYRTHELARRVVPKHMAEYISRQQKHGELTKWTVALMGGSSKQANDSLIALAGPEFRPAVRKWAGLAGAAIGPAEPYRIGRSVSPIDECLDLTSDEYERALQKTREMWTRDGARSAANEPKLPSGVAVRLTRDPAAGLLLIYALDPAEAECGHPPPSELGSAGPPVIAFAVSFPGSSTGVTVEYVVNSVWAEQEYGHDGG